MTVTEPTPKAAEAMTSVRIITVPADRAGQRLDNFLLGQLKGAPRSLIYKLVRSGQVRVNGGRAKAERKLEGGDEVRVPPVRLNEEGDKAGPPAAFMKRLEDAIVFEDDRLLALNKPSGVASHGGSGISHGLIESLRAQTEARLAGYVVHPRLDPGLADYIAAPALGDDAGITGAIALGQRASRQHSKG